MKFETIKTKAVHAFTDMVNHELAMPGLTTNLNAPVNLSMTALAADLGMTETIRRDTLHKVLERGATLIRNWDVRNVGKLVKLFPTAAPSSWRGKHLQAYIADNETSDWMVTTA